MKRLVYLLSLGVFLSACGEGSIRSIDSDLFFSQENPFQPVITIQGENPITIERTTAWNEPGVFAQSYREGNISNRIQVSSNVNFNKIGSYQIVYSVSDSQGRTSSATRQVIVDDTILPTVTIDDADLGASPSYNKNTPRSIFISDSSGDAIKYQAVVVSANNCSNADFANAPQKNISETFVLNPNVGLNKVCVRGIDEAGNIQATLTESRELVIQNPSLTISLNPTSPTNQTSVTVTANGQGIDFFKVIRIVGDNCSNANFQNEDESSSGVSFNGLTEGVHRFCAIGRNALGDYDLTQVAEETLEVDSIPPTIEIIGPSVAQVNQGGSVTYTVTYTDASTISLNENDVTLNVTGGNATCSKSVSGAGNSSRTVTLSNCTGNGTVGITIAPDSAEDAAGNQAPASAASDTFTVDNEGPTIVITANGTAYNPSNGEVAVTLELCENLALTATADGQNISNLPSFDVSKTGSSSNPITATDALGNSASVNLTLNISLPAAYSNDYSNNVIFHRVQGWSDLTVDRNLFLCEDLTFGDNSQFTSITEYNSIFEGNQKVISNLGTSLFGNLGGSSQVRNLVLKNLAAELTSENTGGLASLNQGLILQVGIRGAVLSISDDGENSFFGGLVGENAGEVINSYFEGQIVDPSLQTAGLVGENLGSIENSYSSTNVLSRALSLVFKSDGGEVANSYWNCGAEACEESQISGEHGIALSLSEMREEDSFDGFDFSTIWKMFDSDSEYRYPVLKFEE